MTGDSKQLLLGAGSNQLNLASVGPQSAWAQDMSPRTHEDGAHMELMHIRSSCTHTFSSALRSSPLPLHTAAET